MSAFISTQEDSWLRDHFEHQTRWIVELSNGISVIQDDFRPGVEPVSAWERLGLYCVETSLYIVKMRLQFRSHTVPINLGHDPDGVFFCKSIVGSLGTKNVHAYLTGRLHGQILEVEKWRVPELISSQFLDDKKSQFRDPKQSGKCLITKPGITLNEVTI